MPRQHDSTTEHNDGWLITPRALTSVATIVGLVYTLHAPVRYVLHVGASVDALTARVAMLETEIEHQRSSVPASSAAREQSTSDRPAKIARGSGPGAGDRSATRSTAAP